MSAGRRGAPEALRDRLDAACAGAVTAAPVSPLVSVIVTFYNQARYVGPTLDSALTQTYPAVEVIAVDDGSTDETPERCAAYADRIAFIRQANGGVARARNAGLQRARGAHVAFLDGDDLWEPDKLAAQVAAAVRFPAAGLIAVDGTMFCDEPARTDGRVAGPEASLADSLYGAPVRPRLEASGEPVALCELYDTMLEGKFGVLSTPSQVMIPAAVLREVGPWNVRFGVSADYELYLRIAARWPFALVKRKLMRYRINPEGLSGHGFQRGFRWAEEKPAIFRSLPERARASRLIAELARDVSRAAYYRGARGERRWATRYLLRYAVLSRRPHIVLPYLGALWCPAGLRAWTSQTLRRLAISRGGR